MAIVVKKFFSSVDANSYSESTFTPANGQSLNIIEYGGTAALSSNVKIEIYWGSTLLFATHEHIIMTTDEEITGDGSTVLKIKLVNDTGSTETFGAWYKYSG